MYWSKVTNSYCEVGSFKEVATVEKGVKLEEEKHLVTTQGYNLDVIWCIEPRRTPYRPLRFHNIRNRIIREIQ